MYKDHSRSQYDDMMVDSTGVRLSRSSFIDQGPKKARRVPLSVMALEQIEGLNGSKKVKSRMVRLIQLKPSALSSAEPFYCKALTSRTSCHLLSTSVYLNIDSDMIAMC